jgi:PadR family transcriptional regulator
VRIERELMRGAGVLAVLKLLQQRDMYGYELAEALTTQSDGVLEMGHSTLYPMLYNLESKGLIQPILRESNEGRQRKYYRLTADGAAWLDKHQSQWSRLVEAMSRFGLSDDPRQAPARGSQ